MEETVPDKTKKNSPFSSISRLLKALKSKRSLFVFLLFLTIPSLYPLYFTLFPPLVDLPEHLLINKLFWETVIGTSNLDLDISWFLGYRLFPVLVIFLIAASNLFAIPLIYLPKIVALILMSFHAAVVGIIHFYANTESTWRSRVLKLCYSLPAVVAMYSACWYIGFVNYTLAITLLLPSILFTERVLASGKTKDEIILFISLVLVYAAHPFAVVFWLVWCFGRTVASFVMASIGSEWKRILILGMIILPLVLYHLIATAGSRLAPSTKLIQNYSPFISPDEWFQARFLDVLNGEYLKADLASEPLIFSLSAIGLILVSIIVAFRLTKGEVLKKLAISSILFIYIASWLNEKFFPVPTGFWLAYDYRFSSTVYIVGLSVAGFIFIRTLPISKDNLRHKFLYSTLALISVFSSVVHLIGVEQAYQRHDLQARKFMDKVFNYEDPAHIPLPRSRWHPDGKVIRHYICLVETDCNPEGTFFKVFTGHLYPVAFKSEGRPHPIIEEKKRMRAESAKNGETLSRPRGIVSDGNGNYLVADTGNSRIKKFDRSGRPLAVFGNSGKGEGELSEPYGIDVDDLGNIYVTDAENAKLVLYARNGRFLKQWTGPSPGFSWPRDLEIGPNGMLYIIDQGYNRVVRFDPRNEEFIAWGTAGVGDGEFRGATGIAIGGNMVFIADAQNDRIQVFDLDGRFVRNWYVPLWGRSGPRFADLAYDEVTERLYVVSGASNGILLFDTLGNPSPLDLDLNETEKLGQPFSILISNEKQGRTIHVLTGNGIKALKPN